MYKLKHRKIQHLTPDKAKFYFDLPAYGADRKLNQRHKNDLKNKMKAGLFRHANIATAELLYNDGEMVRVNGQHTTLACYESKIAMEALWEHYECETPEDFAKLWGQFDTNKVRNLRNLVSQYEFAAIEDNRLRGPLGSNVAYKSVAALTWIHLVKSDNFEIGPIPNSEKIRMFDRYLSDIKAISIILDVEPKNRGIKKNDFAHINKTPIVAAMLLTYYRCQKDTFLFWAKVRDGEALTRRMPTYALRNWLQKVVVNKGKGGASLKQLTSPHEMIAKSITAWNAFRRGETTALKYYATKSLPKPK